MPGLLALTAAVGLMLSILGSWNAMRSTPILGGDAEGYLAMRGDAPIDKLVRQQRLAWRLLFGGFVLQFVAAAAYAYLSLR